MITIAKRAIDFTKLTDVDVDNLLKQAVDACIDHARGLTPILSALKSALDHVLSYSNMNSLQLQRSFIQHAAEHCMSIINGDHLFEDSNRRVALDSIDSQAINSMTLHTRWVLISAFLAAFNPANMDEIFCAVKHKKVSKRNEIRKAPDLTKPCQPSQFGLDRLIRIVRMLLDKEDDKSPILDVDIISIVAKLEENEILMGKNAAKGKGATRKNNFTSLKYNFVCDASFVVKVAASVKLDLRKHLWDVRALEK